MKQLRLRRGNHTEIPIVQVKDLEGIRIYKEYAGQQESGCREGSTDMRSMDLFGGGKFDSSFR